MMYNSHLETRIEVPAEHVIEVLRAFIETSELVVAALLFFLLFTIVIALFFYFKYRALKKYLTNLNQSFKDKFGFSTNKLFNEC